VPEYSGCNGIGGGGRVHGRAGSGRVLQTRDNRVRVLSVSASADCFVRYMYRCSRLVCRNASSASSISNLLWLLSFGNLPARQRQHCCSDVAAIFPRRHRTMMTDCHGACTQHGACSRQHGACVPPLGFSVLSSRLAISLRDICSNHAPGAVANAVSLTRAARLLRPVGRQTRAAVAVSGLEGGAMSSGE
jgi:hypothetical protein